MNHLLLMACIITLSHTSTIFAQDIRPVWTVSSLPYRVLVEVPPVDTGSRTSQREQQIGVLANIQARQAQVERALERIDAGTYGSCESCGRAIAPERLEAFPSVTSCVACKGSNRRVA